MSSVTSSDAAAKAARTADPDIDRARAGAGEIDPGRDVEAARATAAADRLGENRIAVVAGPSPSRRGAGRRRPLDCKGHRFCASAAAARTADADIDSAGSGARGIDRTGDVEPARAAAAAERLRDDAARSVAVRDGRDKRFVDVGVARVDVGDDHARNAAAAARSAEPDVDAARARARRRNSARDVEAAGTTAAADGLDEDAVAVVAFGVGRSGDVDRDRFADAAAAARSADPDIGSAGAGAGRVDRRQ